MNAPAAADADIGQNSEDECCLCGRLWDPSCTGWPMCDTPNCPNVCCSTCSQALIVSDMFYCPLCAGSGQSAVAAVGGAIATTVSICNELDALPLSQKAIKAILRNLLKQPENPKYRRLRLNNPKVKSLLDLDPCQRLLSLVGFVQQQENNEPVLVLEGSVNKEEVQQLLDILEGLSYDAPNGETKNDDFDDQKRSGTEHCAAVSSKTSAKNETSVAEALKKDASTPKLLSDSPRPPPAGDKNVDTMSTADTEGNTKSAQSKNDSEQQKSPKRQKYE